MDSKKYTKAYECFSSVIGQDLDYYMLECYAVIVKMMQEYGYSAKDIEKLANRMEMVIDAIYSVIDVME